MVPEPSLKEQTLPSSILDPSVVTATVESAQEVPRVLGLAVERVREAAVDDTSRGILVTRHAPGHFSIRLSDEVPYGLTRERYAY